MGSYSQNVKISIWRDIMLVNNENPKIMGVSKKLADRITTLIISLVLAVVIYFEVNPTAFSGILGQIDPQLTEYAGMILVVVIIVLNALTPEWRAKAAKFKGYEKALDELPTTEQYPITPAPEDEDAKN